MLRGEVWTVSLNPIKGSEQKGIRPVVIVSPNTMNAALETKVVVPLTTKKKNWPSRVDTDFKSSKGQAMCEQIRTVSAKRFVDNLGVLSDGEIVEILSTLNALYGQA